MQRYEELKLDIAAQLDKLHCQKLSMFFGLSPAETDRILQDEEPGKMLMTILDERELIMPKKMIDLYEGLKGSKLDKVARKIMEYTRTITKIDEQAAQEVSDN